MAIVFLGIGSNLGHRAQNIYRAVKKIEEAGIKVLKRSTVIETKPIGGPPQEKFLNAVIKVETSLPPHELLATLQGIEQTLGRIRTVKNGPRTIDLDILIYDDLVLTTNELTIPHSRMIERDFVMIPLKEIAPEIVEQLSHAHH